MISNPGPTRIPKGVWALGLVSMFMDVSSELIHGLLPIFMTTTLGISAFGVGLIEGAAEGAALLVKALSGALSDYMARRKPLAVAGYGLSALSKPLFAIATGAGTVFLARFVDRIGKGIRGAPRDALVADIAPAEIRGAAFGLRQSLDTIGAVAGPALAMALMLAWNNDVRSIFWVAAAPGFLSVAILIAFVREPHKPASSPSPNPIHLREIKRLSGAYWRVVAIGAAFMLARFSEAFLVLRLQQTGLPISAAPLALVVMNLVYALSAYPFGKLSDRLSHRLLLALGFGVLIIADLTLAFAVSWGTVLIGIAIWGLHMGMTQGLLAAMVAHAAQEDLRGTAFGFFHLIGGMAMLVSSALAGLLWQTFGAEYAFHAGAFFCVAGLAGLLWEKTTK
jgi:MFS family permease